MVLRSDGSYNSIVVMLDTALTSKLRISTSSGATKQGKCFQQIRNRNGTIDSKNFKFWNDRCLSWWGDYVLTISIGFLPLEYQQTSKNFKNAKCTGHWKNKILNRQANNHQNMKIAVTLSCCYLINYRLVWITRVLLPYLLYRVAPSGSSRPGECIPSDPSL